MFIYYSFILRLTKTYVPKDDKLVESIQLTDLSGKTRKIASKEDTRIVKQVICMLIAVVLLFAICWGPLLVVDVLTAYQQITHIKMGSEKHIYNTFHLMAYFNR